VRKRLSALLSPRIDPLDPLPTPAHPDLLAIDLGCGAAKRPGSIGLDLEPAPGVDHVLDLSRDRLPFEADSVGDVFSSHFIEHLEDPTALFQELGRVCAHRARFELWTPFAWHDTAVFLEHKSWWTHQFWMHVVWEHWQVWRKRLGTRWHVDEFVYVIEPHMQQQLRDRGLDLRFSVDHLMNVVSEFGVRGWIDKDDGDQEPTLPIRCYAASRADSYRTRYPLDGQSRLSLGAPLRQLLRR